MEQQQSDKFCCQSIADSPSSAAKSQCSNAESRQQPEVGAADLVSARKVQKADREKLRRDRLNEQFSELGNALDADRPKNDKATILTDTIQLLKDLTSEVDRLRADCAVLTEESRELTQEKSELREEKLSLKADIDSLNTQYQQRARVMFPWGPGDPSVVMAPPYSYPMTLAGPIAIHPPLQPYPFFGSQNVGAIPNHCSTFVPYPTPNNIVAEQQSVAEYASTSRVSSKQDSISKSSDCQRSKQAEKGDDSGRSGDVLTELELKTPGSSGQQEASSGDKKGKQTQRKEKAGADASASSGRLSNTQGHQESSSNSVVHRSRPDK